MSVSYTDEDQLLVPPLTREEKAWIRKLQKTLEECPDRLELFTIGDPSIGVIDRDGAKLSEIADGAAYDDGILLASIPGKPTVHGVSG